MNSQAVWFGGGWCLPASRIATMSGVVALSLLSSVAMAAYDWQHYQVILDREPFGRVPKTGEGGVGGSDGSGEDAGAQEPEGPQLEDVTRLSGVSLYGGAPAASFTDTTTGKSFWMREGETVGEFTLVSVDASGTGITLRKGAQEAHLTLKSADKPAANAPASTPANNARSGRNTGISNARGGAVAAPGGGWQVERRTLPGGGWQEERRRVSQNGGFSSEISVVTSSGQGGQDNLSYRERQQQRAEAARRQLEERRMQAEEERQRAEEAKLSQKEQLERATREAVQKELREVAINALRTGSTAPLPNVELTHEDVARLEADGISLQTAGGGAAGENVSPAAEDAEAEEK